MERAQDAVTGMGVAMPPPLPDVHIFAFGRKGYAFAAANLAASIKRWSPSVRVILHAETIHLDHWREHHRTYFDAIEELEPRFYTNIGRLDPGRLKSRLYDILPEGEHLYLDADCMAVKDLRPLLSKLSTDPRPYIAEVVARGTAKDAIEYCPWASPAKQAAKLPEGATIYGLQTSWAFIRKTVEGAERPFFDKVKTNHDRAFLPSELDNRWGDCIPDELSYGFTCSEMGIDPGGDRSVMFYGNKLTLDTLDAIRSDYFLMTQYGRIGKGGSVRPQYLDMYDKEMTRVFEHFGERHIFKLDMIAVDKWVDSYKRAS